MEYEAACAKGSVTTEQFNRIMFNASAGAKEYAIQTKGASGSTDAFVSKQRSAQSELRATATASKTASLAMSALSMAANMFVVGLVTKGLELAVTALNNYIHRVEKANEKIEESRSNYEDAKSSIESMNAELKTTQEKIETLQSKGVLSFTDKEELDNLKEQNNELERSIALQEKKQQNASSQTVNEIKQNKDTLSEDFEKSIKNLSEYKKEYEDTKQIGIKGMSDGTVTLENFEATMTAMDKTMDLYENHVLENIEKFEQYKEDIINKYGTDDISKFSQSDRSLYNSIINQLQDAYKTVYTDSEYNKFIIEPIFDTDKLNGLQDQLLQYFVNGGSTDTSSLEKKFGTDIITALRNACEKAGIDFDKMIEDMYNNSQSKLNELAPIIEDPSSSYDVQKNNISQQIRDYIQNGLSDDDKTILLNADISDINSTKLDQYISEEQLKAENAINSTRLQLESLSKDGNVDLTIRPIIDSSAMQAAGWDVEDGSIAATFTQGEFIWQGDEENGQYVYIHYTPILPDGTVLTPDQLSDYLYDTLEGSQNILDADDKGLILKVDTDLQGISEDDIKALQEDGTQSAQMSNFLNQMGQWDDSLHDVQEGYYLTGDSVDYVDNAVNRLVEDAKKAQENIPDETPILSFTEAISNVQALSAGFDQLDKIYADVLNKEDFDWSSILNNTSFTEAFGECKDAYDEFIKTVANSPDDIDACQEAFNNLATAYIENKGVLNDLTEENKQATITMLEQMGIENAEEVVTATLAHNKEELTLQNVLLANSTMDLSTVTADEIQRLLDEGVVTEEVAKQLASYAVEKQYTNDKVINTEADCNNLIALMKTAEGTTTAVAKLEKLKARLYTTDKNGNSVSRIISEEERKNVEKAINNIAAEFNAKVSETIKVPQMKYNGGSATQKIRDDLNKTSDSAKKSADDLYNDLKNLIDAYMDYMEKSLDVGKIDYNTYCNSVKNYLDNLYHSGKLKAADYFDYVEKMLNKQKDIYDKVLSAVINRLDKEIDKWQKMIDALEAENDKLNDQKDTYDGILSAVEDVIDAEADRYQSLIDDLEEANDKLNKLKDDKDGILSAIADVYDNQIDALNKQSDAIQEQIDALQDKNDELDKQYNKEKAIYELEKAERLRNKKLYVEGKGYIYTQDQEAVRDARKNLDDIKTEELIDKLQKEKDNIADAIDNLQKYKEKWAEVTSAYEKEQNRQLALAQYGYDFEKTILLNRESDIEAFKNTYIAIQKELNDNSEMIDSYNEKVTYYNNLKKKWSDISGAYDKETNRQLAIAKWGANYEQIILEGRIQDINAFKDAYLAIQQQIDDNTNLINSYNEKIDYYNKLKEQWQSITEEYDKQMNAQYASQVLGADWEAKILSGRMDTLTSFSNDYVSLQNAITEAQWNATNERIKAYQAEADAAVTAANAVVQANRNKQNNTDTDTTAVGNSTYKPSSAGMPGNANGANGGNRYAAATAEDRKNNPNTIMPNEQKKTIAKSKKLANNIRQYSKGGIVKVDPNNILSDLAKHYGEDGGALVRNGEEILTEKESKDHRRGMDLFESFSNMVKSNNYLPQMVPSFNTPSNITTTDNSSVVVNIGDIKLEGVQNPKDFGAALMKYIPGEFGRQLSGRSR